MNDVSLSKEKVIEILKGIDPQCGADCPISREECSRCDSACLVSEALNYAIDVLSGDVDNEEMLSKNQCDACIHAAVCRFEEPENPCGYFEPKEKI